MSSFYKTEKMLGRHGDTIRVWATEKITHLELHFSGDVFGPRDFVLSGSDGVMTAKSLIKHLTTFVQANAASKTAPALFKGYAELPDQTRTIYQHMARAGSISAREAFDDYSITSATLSRRICDLEENGWFIKRETKLHPISQRRYTRYSLVS